MSNHYAHPRGRPRLLKAISKHYSASFENLAKEGRELVNEEIVVTAGANGGTYAALCAHLQPGDEVICFEPFFDQYFATIHFNTGTPKFVPLRPPTGKGIKSCDEWTIDFDELRKAFGPKTKAIIVNTPHNPVGKVFTREELEKIAELCIEFNVLCLADEVYDCMVYDDKKHLRIAGLPGMWERTLTILSGGSEFEFFFTSLTSLPSLSWSLERGPAWTLEMICGLIVESLSTTILDIVTRHRKCTSPIKNPNPFHSIVHVSPPFPHLSPRFARLESSHASLGPLAQLTSRILRSNRLASRMVNRSTPTHSRHTSRPLSNRILHKYPNARSNSNRSRTIRSQKVL